MWVFNRHGFFSAVKKDCTPDEITVRTRDRADLVRMLDFIGEKKLKSRIVELDTADYRFRIVIKHRAWAMYCEQMATDINYDNFKNAALANDRGPRSSAYHRCWAALFDWQDALYSKIAKPPSA